VPRRAATDLGLRRGPAVIVGAFEATVGDFDTRAARRLTLVRDEWTPDLLVEPVAARFQASAPFIRLGRRTRPESRARAVICFVACDCAGASGMELASLTGVSESAVVGARRRGLQLLRDRRWTADELLAESLASRK
jgi:hypothetical protein